MGTNFSGMRRMDCALHCAGFLRKASIVRWAVVATGVITLAANKGSVKQEPLRVCLLNVEWARTENMVFTSSSSFLAWSWWSLEQRIGLYALSNAFQEIEGWTWAGREAPGEGGYREVYSLEEGCGVACITSVVGGIIFEGTATIPTFGNPMSLSRRRRRRRVAADSSGLRFTRVNTDAATLGPWE